MLAAVVLMCITQGMSVGNTLDANGDGVVNTADLKFVGDYLGRLGDHPADVNDDAVVNIVDLMLVQNAIGTAAPPPRRDVGGMVLIPAGEFQMGSNNGSSDERPVHTVYVDAFYIDKYEVTNAEYAAFLNARGKHTDRDHIWFDIGDPDARIDLIGGAYLVEVGYENHPVVEVTWYGAMAYAKWTAKRLPTEAEWEKAARGGLVGKRYPWGNTIDDTKANYNRNVGDTTPVGSYPANGYGLYDMVGNVWEWCLDAYDRGFYANSPRQNPIAGANNITEVLNAFTNNNLANVSRVLRGGSWFNGAFVRVAYRNGINPRSADFSGGFRCARTLIP
ncbi:MAG: SUMF1/EgtB/PvdO family nonheme iron enzyme [Candidatus Poribacteria bacterium]|nr:SUMF1/EgtB/PvdO family nonheme iron enzyme [Candidatus Poribacteria bacterium]